LDEKLNAAIGGLFFFRSKITSGKFIALPVIMQTFTAQTSFIAGMHCADAVGRIDFNAWALVKFAHKKPPKTNAAERFTNEIQGERQHTA
jgi:hypothetical protein